MSRQGDWPPRYRTPGDYRRVRVAWFLAAAAFLVTGLAAAAFGEPAEAFAAGVMLGVTVRLARRVLRRLPGRRQ